MFKPDTLNSRKLNSRRAVALGALVLGLVGFSAAAGAATPMPLFPFILTPPTEAAPPVQAAARQRGRDGGAAEATDRQLSHP
jgi:hypothetical protein